MKVIAIYPGRFQPMGPHHVKAYEWLANKFGVKNTYIVTSNKVNEKSPFNFDQKKQIMVHSGIPANKIIEVKSPYNPVELLATFNQDNTVAIFMYGEKDAGRLRYTKTDGSPAYFQKYDESNKNLEPIRNRGYVITAPHINVHGDISGTKLREMIPTMTPKQFKSIFGWFEESTYNMMKDVLSKTQEQVIEQDLTERKQVGEVYHFTDFPSLTEILKSELLRASDFNDRFIRSISNSKYSYGISTTRYKNFHKREKGRALSAPLQIALKLDGDKLSDSYQVTPYDDANNAKPGPDVQKRRDTLGDEAEQLWYGKKIESNRGIPRIIGYIKEIIILDDFVNRKFAPQLRNLRNLSDTFMELFGDDDIPIRDGDIVDDDSNLISGEGISIGYYVNKVKDLETSEILKRMIKNIPLALHELSKRLNIPITYENGQLVEVTNTGAYAQEVDDGPRAFYGNLASYKARSEKIADILGWDVQDWIINLAQELEKHDTEPPKGPPLSVTYFPVGDKNEPNAGTKYSKDMSALQAYIQWVKDAKRRIKVSGLDFTDTLDAELAKYNINLHEGIEEGPFDWFRKEIDTPLVPFLDQYHPNWRKTKEAKKAWDSVVEFTSKVNPPNGKYWSNASDLMKEIEYFPEVWGSLRKLYKYVQSTDMRGKSFKEFQFNEMVKALVNASESAWSSNTDVGIPDEFKDTKTTQIEPESKKDPSSFLEKRRARNLEPVPELPDLKYDNRFDKKTPGWRNHAVVKIAWDIAHKIAIEPEVRKAFSHKGKGREDDKIKNPHGGYTSLLKYLNSSDKKFVKRYQQLALSRNNYPPFKDLLRGAINLDIGIPGIFREHLIIEGGAAGHMAHPFDDSNTTFADLKEIITRALSGKLGVEKAVQEKTDGQNLLVTYKDGRIGAARNKSTIIEPMSIEAVAQKFEGRGPIKDAFVNAMNDLEKALKRIPEDELNNFFQNGRRFVNLEILFPPTKNIIDYGEDSYLQFHGMIEYDEVGNKVQSFPEAGETLQKAVAKVNANIQDTFEIIPPIEVQLEEIPDLDEKLNYFIGKLNGLQKEFGLNDSNTIQDYYNAWWSQYIDNNLNITDETIKQGLIDRWSGKSKAFRLNNKNIPNPELLQQVKEFESSKAKEFQTKIFNQFEDLIFGVGAEVMINAANLLALRNPQSQQSLRKDLAQTIKQLRKNPDNFNSIKPLLRQIKSIGGFEKLIPSEGLVFYYKGKPYKLTGGFTPIHRILSKRLYGESLIREGGWISTKTQDTKLTPQVVEKSIEVFENFIGEFNVWLSEQGLESVRAVKPIGSTAYYQKDLDQNPEAEYGDIDYLVEYPESETPTFWKKKVVEFVKDTNISYVDKDSEKAAGNAVILEIEPDTFVQIDLIASKKSTSKFAAGRFTPEYGLKGFTIGNLYSALASTLNISISDSGVIARFKDGQLAPAKLRKGVEKIVVSLDLDNFLIDLAKFLAQKSNLTLKTIDPKLKQFAGVNSENPTIAEFAQGVVGFAKTLESNGILGGPLFPGVETAKELISTIRQVYLQKNKQASRGSKFDKAQSDSAFKAIEKIKKHADKASQIVNKHLRAENIIKEGGNIEGVNSLVPKPFLESTIDNGLSIFGLKDLEYTSIGNINKSFLGDIDIACAYEQLRSIIRNEDMEDFWKDLDSYLSKNTEFKHVVNKGLKQFHLLVPVVDENGSFIDAVVDRDGTTKREQGICQIDIMLGDIEWMKDYFSGTVDSNYKAVYRNLLVMEILSTLIWKTKNPEIKRKLQLSKHGVEIVDFSLTPKGKKQKLKVINFTNKADKLIKFLFNENVSWNDVNTFEKVFDQFESDNFRFPNIRQEVVSKLKNTLMRMKLPIPEELG